MTEIFSSHKNGYVEVVASENGQQIGRAVSINLGNTALLEEFHVDRDYRGRGIGSSLMEEAEKLAAEDGKNRLLL